ncbi:MAG TPA: twin-arginine translocase TatA/TatE family subunit [Thermodesulfovibrionales bacterium]|nr:twin-arginine translocase TatA/TatE family subunit [Thermodesulfovibrionales bacterium]
MFDLGIQELIVIFVVALIVFGPKRLPELGKSLGKGMLELRKALQGMKEQMDTELDTTPKPGEITAPPIDEQRDEKPGTTGADRQGEKDREMERKDDTVNGR